MAPEKYFAFYEQALILRDTITLATPFSLPHHPPSLWISGGSFLFDKVSGGFELSSSGQYQLLELPGMRQTAEVNVLGEGLLASQSS